MWSDSVQKGTTKVLRSCGHCLLQRAHHANVRRIKPVWFRRVQNEPRLETVASPLQPLLQSLPVTLLLPATDLSRAWNAADLLQQDQGQLREADRCGSLGLGGWALQDYHLLAVEHKGAFVLF